jgi:hypothetical protein
MNMYVGPFKLSYLLITLFLLYLVSLYLIIKKKMGIESVLMVLFFPFIGSIAIISYSIFNSRKRIN